ncbi:MAG: phosphate signaling complex protein PhoU, partial [Acidimicrobiia bacterium]
LDEIRLRLVDMGTLVLANIRRAGVVVTENRLDEVDSVIAADLPINEAYDELEAKVFQILALQQPVATDLRFLVASTRILYEMERTGDLAVNIVKSMNRIDGVPAEPVLEAILGQLIDAAAGMFGRGVEAITTMDPAIGLGAETEDEETDRLTSELFSAVTARQDDLGLEASVALFYMGRFLERIADHGVNIAQNITFAVTGSFPEDY